MGKLFGLLIVGFLMFVGFQIFVEKKSIEETKLLISDAIDKGKTETTKSLLETELKNTSGIHYDKVECFDDIEFGVSCKVYDLTDAEKTLSADITIYDVSSYFLAKVGSYNLFNLNNTIRLENIKVINIPIGYDGNRKEINNRINKYYDSYLVKIQTDEYSKAEKFEMTFNITAINSHTDDYFSTTLELNGNKKAKEALRIFEKVLSDDKLKIDSHRKNLLVDDFINNTYFGIFKLDIKNQKDISKMLYDELINKDVNYDDFEEDFKESMNKLKTNLSPYMDIKVIQKIKNFMLNNTNSLKLQAISRQGKMSLIKMISVEKGYGGSTQKHFEKFLIE